MTRLCSAVTLHFMVREYDESLRYTAPGAVGAMHFADSHRHASPRRRRLNRIVAWAFLAVFVVTFGVAFYGMFSFG